MDKKILNNIRKNNFKIALVSFVPTVIIFVLFLMASFSAYYSDDFKIWYLIVILIFGFFNYFLLTSFVHTVILIFNPLKADIFKKYGSPNQIANILEEIEGSIIYQDKSITISNDYICDLSNYDSIVKCEDVLGIHKLVHKTNFVTDYYQIVLTDKYGQEVSYKYKCRDEDKVNNLLQIIAERCPNAEWGYTEKQREYIRENSIKLPSEIKKEDNDSKEKIFKCDNCGAFVKEKDNFCPNCGEKFDENK